MNKFEIAVMKFANDLDLGTIVPTKIMPSIDFVFDENGFNEDKELLSKLEFLLRHGKAKIVVEGEYE